MSTNEQYQTGYAFFTENPNLTSEQLKQVSPLFREGYRTAQSDNLKRSNKSFPLVLSTIPRCENKFNPTWNDILAATRRPRFAKLHNIPELNVVLNGIIKAVELKSDQIHRYKDVVRLVDEAFDLILQYGYDCGVLNEHDLKKYNYEPK